MKPETPFLEGVFLKRYKRFFADVQLGDEVVTAHVPNTGSMKSCNAPGSKCLVSHDPRPERKLKYTLERVQAPSGAWVGVNTALPNKIVKEALQQGLFEHWRGRTVHAEHKITKETRFDFMLEGADGSKHYVEVKNVSLAEGSRALFPDSVTERGQKHLRELMRLAGEGHSVECVFTIQRDDVESFTPAAEIDEDYARLFWEAVAAGVRMTPVLVKFDGARAVVSSQLLPIVR